MTSGSVGETALLFCQETLSVDGAISHLVCSGSLRACILLTLCLKCSSGNFTEISAILA